MTDSPTTANAERLFREQITTCTTAVVTLNNWNGWDVRQAPDRMVRVASGLDFDVALFVFDDEDGLSCEWSAEFHIGTPYNVIAAAFRAALAS